MKFSGHKRKVDEIIKRFEKEHNDELTVAKLKFNKALLSPEGRKLQMERKKHKKEIALLEKKYRRSIDRLAKRTLAKITTGMEAGVAENIKVIALIESSLNDAGEPDYGLVSKITKWSKPDLIRLWENKENVFRQAPNHVSTRKKNMALEGLEVMEEIMASFDVTSLSEMKDSDKLKLLDRLDKITDEVAKGSDSEINKNTTKLVVDFVVPGTAETDFLSKKSKSKFDFIDVEEIEYEEDEE